MASFGKVLDLLDDRYLELQDVVGNVEPLPTLVPYDDYKQNVLVYRMDTNLDIYMALMQDFTDRRARELGKELWTWCVQWEVEAAPSKQTTASPSSPKKPRLDTQQSEVLPEAKTEQPKAPVFNIIERRVVDPTLMLQDDMLRCLIDIVQVSSTLVPNFIEFLYRWIDFYEGDGKALKAAMRWEIPSLWEFEYHPLVLPQGPKQATPNTEEEDTARAVRAGTSNSSHNEEIEELKAGSHTKKTREKPDLAALEGEVELSERLQYREVHYGIKPPKLSQSIPRLVNIPRDPRSRRKYYAACFKSRQRAFNLLIEAGLTVQQISNYKKQQLVPVRETPRGGDGGGLRHYEKDARAAQTHFAEKEKEMAVRAKHMEIAISNRLAFEAGVAARSNVTAGPTGVPLIPATPSYAPRPAIEIDMLQRLRIGKGSGQDRINFVPKPLVGRLKSKLFEGATYMDWSNNLAATGGMLRQNGRNFDDIGHEDSSSSDEDSDEEEIDPPLRPWERPGPYSSVSQQPSAPTASSSPSVLPPVPTLSPGPNLPELPMLSIFSGPPALPSPSAPSASPPRPFAARPENARTVDHQRMQVLAQTGAIPQSIADGEPWTVQQIGDFIDSLTPAQRHRVIQVMRSTYATMAAHTGPTFLDAPVAGPSTASASMSVQSTLTPMNTARGTGSAHTQRPPVSFPPPPLPSPFSSQIPTGQSPFQLPPGFAGQTTTTLPMRPPMPTSYSALAHGPSQPPPQRRVSSDPASLSYLLTLGSGGSMQRNNPPSSGTSQQHSLAPRPSLPELPRVPSLPSLPPLPQIPQLSLHPPTPRLPHPSPSPAWAHHPSFATPSQTTTPPNPTPWNTPQPPPQTLSTPFSPSPPRPHPSRPSQPTLSVPPNPLSTLNPPFPQTSPLIPTTTTPTMPILIYLPKALRPGNTLGPGGTPLGDTGVRETDALLLGHSAPGSGTITLSRAIFLPLGIAHNVQRRVRSGGWTVLETYSAGLAAAGGRRPDYAGSREAAAHAAVYAKLSMVYDVMGRSGGKREDEVTKRWRVTRGPMTLVERGSVWEGWGVVLGAGIGMGAVERAGAVSYSGMIDEGVEQKSVSEEVARRRREIEEMLAEDEEDVSEDEEMET